jgi:hypothetical protein
MMVWLRMMLLFDSVLGVDGEVMDNASSLHLIQDGDGILQY